MRRQMLLGEEDILELSEVFLHHFVGFMACHLLGYLMPKWRFIKENKIQFSDIQ